MRAPILAKSFAEHFSISSGAIYALRWTTSIVTLKTGSNETALTNCGTRGLLIRWKNSINENWHFLAPRAQLRPNSKRPSFLPSGASVCFYVRQTPSQTSPSPTWPPQGTLLRPYSKACDRQISFVSACRKANEHRYPVIASTQALSSGVQGMAPRLITTGFVCPPPRPTEVHQISSSSSCFVPVSSNYVVFPRGSTLRKCQASFVCNGKMTSAQPNCPSCFARRRWS